MSQIKQTLIQPAAECSPRDGLPQRDCQGRRKVPQGGCGSDANLDAVPGDLPATRDPQSMMFDAYVKAAGALIEMHDLILQHPTALSMSQVWCDCEFLQRHLKTIKFAVVNHLPNDFPLVVRGYKGTPE